MAQGQIKKLMEKGFGFISRDGETKDLFFHHSALQDGIQFDELREGQPVQFDEGQSEKGPRAENIALI